MTRIYKYKLGINGQIVAIKGQIKNILTVQAQDGWPHIWCEVDDDIEEWTLRTIAIGTGWDLPNGFLDGYSYIGTVQDEAGFVWHYYGSEYEEL